MTGYNCYWTCSTLVCFHIVQHSPTWLMFLERVVFVIACCRVTRVRISSSFSLVTFESSKTTVSRKATREKRKKCTDRRGWFTEPSRCWGKNPNSDFSDSLLHERERRLIGTDRWVDYLHRQVRKSSDHQFYTHDLEDRGSWHSRPIKTRPTTIIYWIRQFVFS